MDTMGDNLETKIREFRQIKGLTQQELADSVGVTRQTINALENARYNPSLLLAYRITKILDQESIEDVLYSSIVQNYDQEIQELLDEVAAEEVLV